MNMATNARDAMPHGGCLSVTTRQLLSKRIRSLPDLLSQGHAHRRHTGTGLTGHRWKESSIRFYHHEVGKEPALACPLPTALSNSTTAQSWYSEPGKGTTFIMP
jgi:hypothetical protein